MENAFKKLPFSKQNRIINSALEEFADKGYQKASTDAIALKANISKGSLFNYFGSKQALYYTLCDYTFTHYFEAVVKRYKKDETDFLERLRAVLHVKIQVLCETPCIVNFFRMIVADTSKAILTYKERKGKLLAENAFAPLDMHVIFEGIDISLFKDDVDITRAVHSIIWSFDGFTQEITKTLRKSFTHINYQAVFNEAEGYMEHFKAIYYKGQP